MRTTTTMVTMLLAAATIGTAHAAPSPEPHHSPLPAPSQSAPVDLGTKTSGVGTTDPVAQPSAGRMMDPLAPGHDVNPQPDTPGKTGLGVTDRVPLGQVPNAPGSKTDGIGSPPAAGPGAR